MLADILRAKAICTRLVLTVLLEPLRPLSRPEFSSSPHKSTHFVKGLAPTRLEYWDAVVSGAGATYNSLPEDVNCCTPAIYWGDKGACCFLHCN